MRNPLSIYFLPPATAMAFGLDRQYRQAGSMNFNSKVKIRSRLLEHQDEDAIATPRKEA